MPFNASDLNEPEQQVGSFMINGERVDAGDDALATLRAETARRGISTFAAFVNGRELNSLSEISNQIDEGSVVEVRTYAKPGALHF